MADTGLANTPLINYFFYKQSTTVASATTIVPYPILSVADGGNGQLVLTTSTTENLSAGTAITIQGSTLYDGNYTVISVTSTTINISGVYTATDTGTWELASNITGATAGDPLDFGTVEFYDNDDQVTLQDVYTDRDLTIPYTNPITLDAVGSCPPIYFQDSPYYIVIKDKFNNLVATLQNYLPGDNSGGNTTTNIQNLFPSYGFDSQVDNGDYSENSLPSDTPDNYVSAGWYWEISTTQTNPNNTYTFQELATDGIEGNPKNELILNTTNNTSGDSENNLVSVIGDYSSFQNDSLAMSVQVRAIAGTLSDIVVFLRRTNQGINESPILVGNIAVTATRQQQIIAFTVPALVTADYENGDVLELLFALPLDTDFSVGITGTWLQQSDDGTVSISESPIALNEAQQTFGNAFRDLQDIPLYQKLGLPLGLINGSVAALPLTGSIFIGKGDYSFATRMDNPNGVLLLRNTVNQLTSANRLIDYLRTQSVVLSKSTVIATPTTNTVTLTVGIGPNSPLISPSGYSVSTANPSASGTNVTLTESATGLSYGLNSYIDLTNKNKLIVTFNDTFAPTAIANQFAGIATLPVSAPIVSWFGQIVGANISVSPANPYIFEGTSGVDVFPTTLKLTTLNAGSGSENAQMSILFDEIQWKNFAVNLILSATTAAVKDTSYQSFLNEKCVYENMSQSFTEFGSSVVTRSYNMGYLAYNDITSNTSPQVDPPPRCIRFNITDGATTGINAPTGVISNLVVSIKEGQNSAQAANATNMAINNSWINLLTIVSVPTNGDYVRYSVGTQDYIVIYYDTTLSKPANPVSAAYPIYVEYTPTQTTTEIASATALAIESASIGVPYAYDLGLPQLENDLADYFYYMVN